MKRNAVTDNLTRLALLLLLCPLSIFAQTPSASTGVQGIVPSSTNGNAVLPVINGSLKPALNGTTAIIGLDNFNTTTQRFSVGTGGIQFLATPPAPSKPNEFAIAILSQGPTTAGTGLTASPQWTPVPGVPSCNGTFPNNCMSYISNVSTVNNIVSNITNYTSDQANAITAILEFATNNGKAPTLRGGNNTSAATVATSVSTLAGSTVLVAFNCNASPCIMTAGPLLDSQGNVGTLVSAAAPANCPAICGQYVYLFGPTSAAAESVTAPIQAGGTVSIASIVELAGLIPANPNRPAAQINSSNNTFAQTPANTLAENDQGGIFTMSSGFNYQATLTVSQTTVIPLWNITQHGVFQSCTVFERVTGATGTTPTLNTYLQDSPDTLGWNDHISMPQATTAGAWEGTAPVFTGASLAAITSGAVVTTNRALTAGSVVPGPMAAYGQIVFVPAGTTPSFTINLGVTCK